MDESRDLCRELARKHDEAGDPLGWFEALYKQADGDFDTIPWADRGVNRNLTAWCEREGVPQPGARVLVVGCGLGSEMRGDQSLNPPWPGGAAIKHLR